MANMTRGAIQGFRSSTWELIPERSSPLLLAVILRQRVFWRLGFVASSAVMVLGIFQFIAFRHTLGDVGTNAQAKNILPRARSRTHPLQPGVASQSRAIGILFIFSTVFWMSFEQAGSSFNLFADQLTRNNLFGFDFPSSWFQSVEPIFVVALAPVFSWLWLAMRERQPSSPAKFAYGLLAAVIAFAVITYASMLIGAGRVSPIWLMLVYFFQAVGELLLSPVGLSTTTKLAPKRIVGLMMGVWFLSLAAGNYLAGAVASFYKPGENALVGMFGAVALLTLISAAVLAAMAPYMRRLMGTVR